MIIEIYNKTNKNIVNLKKILFNVFTSLHDNQKMNIIFINNKEMQKMNFYYRKKNHPTDILSFENVIDNEYLGDVFISLTKAAEQSYKMNKKLEEEAVFLSLHGYLHLKGFDDFTEESLQQMIEIQNQILSYHRLNIYKYL